MWVLIRGPQNVLHKVSTTFYLHLRSAVDSFHRGEGLKHALVAVVLEYETGMSETRDFTITLDRILKLSRDMHNAT